MSFANYRSADVTCDLLPIIADDMLKEGVAFFHFPLYFLRSVWYETYNSYG